MRSVVEIRRRNRSLKNLATDSLVVRGKRKIKDGRDLSLYILRKETIGREKESRWNFERRQSG